MQVLVTGGAGYIGSHVTRQLREAGYEVVVYDNLSTGHDWAVLDATLVVGDIADTPRLEKVFAGHDFSAVLHFAANIVVPESVTDPLKYYSNNTANTLNLLRLINAFKVPRMVFSSTAAVYGMPDVAEISESTPLNPINPYGASKMMSERMIMDLALASNLNYTILRYFNVAGADLEARIGQATPEATHLIKVACECLTGVRAGMKIFGTDYATRDGTCIRDYIHVEDLASAHVMALRHMEQNPGSQVLNCGYGRGLTVREVIDAVERVAGKSIAVEESGRRDGDPDALTARNDRIREVLGWVPRYDDLDLIVKSALDWEAAWQARRAGV